MGCIDWGCVSERLVYWDPIYPIASILLICYPPGEHPQMPIFVDVATAMSVVVPEIAFLEGAYQDMSQCTAKVEMVC